MSRTLVVPLISTGNVPQLTVDLLLHSLSSEFDFVKSLDSTFVHAFVGPLDYVLEQAGPVLFERTAPKKTYSTALELFYNQSRDLYVLQQRTPIIPGYLNNFVKETILPLIDEYEIEETVILDSFGPLDNDVLEATTVPAKRGTSLISNGTCEVGSVTDVMRNFEQTLNLNQGTDLHFPSSLFTFTPESLQQEISSKQQVFHFAYHLLNGSSAHLKRITYCSAFVHEGDNSEDAHLLCDHLPTIINSLEKILKHTPPVSWKGVYGTRPVPVAFDEGIYV